jgi:chlorite dismutase
MAAVCGEPLAAAPRLAILESPSGPTKPGTSWSLRGVTSHERYVNRAEHEALRSRQPPLGRREATRAALIPITKSDSWWELTQEDRRSIFEERSRHISTGLEFLPAIARRLYHSRDLGEEFDFLTWFEFAPEAAASFDELLGRLRRTEEWNYVTREVEIRLVR